MKRMLVRFAPLARIILSASIVAGITFGETACCGSCIAALFNRPPCCAFEGKPGCTYTVAFRAVNGSVRTVEVRASDTGVIIVENCIGIIFDSVEPVGNDCL